VLITLRELTEQVMIERMRADFVANASHELRTPLTVLRGFIETLQGAAKDDPEAQTRFLSTMEAEAERMSRLINDLLSLSRIEQNEHVLPDEVVDLDQVLRSVIDALSDSSFTYVSDDGSQISVAITVDHEQRSAVVDFTGTSDTHPGNFNAPPAVAFAAVLYVFRSMVDDNIPLNAGCMKPLHLVLPPESMINPSYPAAVIAGNVETSQMIVDTLFGALEVMAAPQGTMNNVIWGNDTHQYYETICGGAGATPRADGCDAVHTHMTNSRLTDPEVLEWRYPVVLESFKIRAGSGGNGRHRGGDGAVRRVRFDEAMELNVISGHREVPPYGMASGQPGAVGINRVIRADGSVLEMKGSDRAEIQPGDVFEIHTPGGGGYGEAQ
jgi:5-oxoprolinase (ATP-hydrolysing)